MSGKRDFLPKKLTRRDGLGNPVVGDRLYYVQNLTRTGGDHACWFKPNAQGYTPLIDEAGTYFGIEVESMRPTDVPWPLDFVQRNAIRVVPVEALRRN